MSKLVCFGTEICLAQVYRYLHSTATMPASKSPRFGYVLGEGLLRKTARKGLVWFGLNIGV